MHWRNRFLLKFGIKLLALGCGSGALAWALAEGAWLFASMLPYAVVSPSIWCATAFGFGLGMLLAPADVWLKRSLPITWRYCLIGSTSTALVALVVSALVFQFVDHPEMVKSNALLVSPWLIGAIGGVIASCGQLLKKRMHISWLIACAEFVYGAFLALVLTQGLTFFGLSAPRFDWGGMAFFSLWGALWCFGRFWPPYLFARGWLRQLNGQGKGMMHPLWAPLWGEYLLQIGSHVKNTIVLRDTMGVFPFHASLLMQRNKKVFIQDQKHNALVLVNFRRIPQRYLDPGDLLKIGNIMLQYCERNQPLLQGAGKKVLSEERTDVRGKRRAPPSRHQRPTHRNETVHAWAGLVGFLWLVPGVFGVEAAWVNPYPPSAWFTAQWFTMVPWSIRLMVALVVGAVSLWWAHRRLEPQLKDSCLEVIAPDGLYAVLSLQQPVSKERKPTTLLSVLQPLKKHKALRLSANLERVHLTWRKNGWLLEDHNQRNALLANRRRIHKVMLRDGNVLDVGNVTLYHHQPRFVQYEEAPLATPSHGQVIKFQPPLGPLMLDTPMLTNVENPKQVFYVTKNIIFIGRSETNDLIIKSQQVRFRHAKIERLGKWWRMVDLSINGNTMLNSRRIEERRLNVGDEISIEGFRFTFGLVTKAKRVRLMHRIPPTERSDNRTLPFQQKRGIRAEMKVAKGSLAPSAHGEEALDTLVMEQGGAEDTGKPGWVNPSERQHYARKHSPSQRTSQHSNPKKPPPKIT